MKCWFFHNWSEWKVFKRGDLLERNAAPLNPLLVGVTIAQERQCSVCKFVEINVQNKTVYNS